MKIRLINNKTDATYTLSGVSEVISRDNCIWVKFNKLNRKELIKLVSEVQRGYPVEYYPFIDNYRIFIKDTSYSFYQCQESN